MRMAILFAVLTLTCELAVADDRSRGETIASELAIDGDAADKVVEAIEDHDSDMAELELQRRAVRHRLILRLRSLLPSSKAAEVLLLLAEPPPVASASMEWPTDGAQCDPFAQMHRCPR